MTSDYETIRLVLSGAVKDFVEDGAEKSERIFRRDDFEHLDDPVNIPRGKQVRVTFDYVSVDGP